MFATVFVVWNVDTLPLQLCSLRRTRFQGTDRETNPKLPTTCEVKPVAFLVSSGANSGPLLRNEASGRTFRYSCSCGKTLPPYRT